MGASPLILQVHYLFGIGSGRVGVGCVRVFGYQHVGSGSRWGSGAMRWGSRPMGLDQRKTPEQRGSRCGGI